MGTPSIAHFGTTIIEKAPPEGSDQKTVPVTGDLKRTLLFLEIFGFQPLIENMYPGMGRQYIWRRGEHDDPDYVEKDSFTSYVAINRPDTDGPRVGDTIFRLTHQDPKSIWRQWKKEGLVEPLNASGDEEAFMSGAQDWLLLMGPDGQRYELGPTQTTRAENHVVYIWTDPAELETVAEDFKAEFDLDPSNRADFHGLGQATILTREQPGITIGLLTPNNQNEIAPRWSDDIFKEAGYSHYRLGSPDFARTQKRTREAFPQGGDVAFVYFRDSYLELVQAEEI
jgi:hypothetical protein